MKNPLKKKTGGVVEFYTQSAAVAPAVAEPPAAYTYTPETTLKELHKGLPFGELEALQASLEVPMEKLAPMLGISKATLHRRKTGGRLDIAESDRVVRYARLMGLATQVLEGPEAARGWLSTPTIGLGGAIPLEYAETEFGAREVEDLLGRIEYGVY